MAYDALRQDWFSWKLFVKTKKEKSVTTCIFDTQEQGFVETEIELNVWSEFLKNRSPINTYKW